MKRLSLLLLIVAILFSCKGKKQIHLPDDVPFLKKNEVNDLKMDDRFIIQTEENSCCSYVWMVNDSLQVSAPVSNLIKDVETITSPADADCNGCSTFHYHIYECIAAGTDTLIYATIPNGNKLAGMMMSEYIITVKAK